MGVRDDLRQVRKKIKKASGDELRNLRAQERKLKNQLKKQKRDNRLTPEQKEMVEYVGGGKKAARNLGILDPLSTIETDRIEALVDPTSDAFIGKQDPQTTELLKKIKGSIDENNDSSIVEQNLKNLSSEIDLLSGSSKDVSELIASQKKDVANAEKQSRELDSVLSIMEGGLAGLNTQEMNALKESGLRESRKTLQRSKRKLEETSARNYLTGGVTAAAQRQLDESFLRNTLDFEQDLLLKNIDVQDERRKDYADTVLKRDSLLADNKNAANQILAETLLSDQATRGDLKAKYADILGSQAISAKDQKDNTNISLIDLFRGTALEDKKLNMDSLLGFEQILQDINKTNLDQESKDKASQVSGILGILDSYETKKTADRSYDLAKSGRSRSGSSSGLRSNIARADEVERVYRDNGII